MRGIAVTGALAAANVAFEGRRVHVRSLFGSCVLQLTVTVVVVMVFEKTLVVRNLVDVDVEVTVTCIGRIVIVRVEVVEGRVTVDGSRVVV